MMHMAPELIATRRSPFAAFPATMPGDVYAVGCVMYQLLYHRPLIADDWLIKNAGRISIVKNTRSIYEHCADKIDALLAGRRNRPQLVFPNTLPVLDHPRYPFA